ncbi:hypothetical protein WT15_16160 [Burkholderia stagnalis]|uniref:hypothetical protein n=1 Tax=Burkholderia stagnalis TaxID=1503054 RepID=UPI00075E765E|nr:hypothetical protein [Burkholderia stagnalis]AOK56610.1 hypothetical protein WT74_28475 [Burkholderia stagnalis]KVN78436.1 hypothetical protein WT15_16160 [Burkholderia stagnalis]KWO25170.1 hypothetical protein WT95_25365 [Burkholderia stagnalis]KWO28806.1 hypothetical protein WT96_28725 [Burkholderia stagnalis]
MMIVLILVVPAIAALFGFAAHVDALTGRIGPQPARAQLDRLRREVAPARAALRRAWQAACRAMRGVARSACADHRNSAPRKTNRIGAEVR